MSRRKPVAINQIMALSLKSGCLELNSRRGVMALFVLFERCRYELSIGSFWISLLTKHGPALARYFSWLCLSPFSVGTVGTKELTEMMMIHPLQQSPIDLAPNWHHLSWHTNSQISTVYSRQESPEEQLARRRGSEGGRALRHAPLRLTCMSLFT